MHKVILQVLMRLFKKAASKDEAIRGYRGVATGAALVAVIMLVLGLSAPSWIPTIILPRFMALFFTAAVIFAAFAGMALISIVLIKRDLF